MMNLLVLLAVFAVASCSENELQLSEVTGRYPSAQPPTDENYLDDIVSISSVTEALIIYNASVVTPNRLHYDAAASFLKPRFTEALRDPVIPRMDTFAFLSLISKDWVVEEIEVFDAVRRWRAANQEEGTRIYNQINRQVRLVAMNPDQLHDIVVQSGLFAVSDLFQAMSIKGWGLKESSYERFANQLGYADVAVDTMGATVVNGSCSPSTAPNALLDASYKTAQTPPAIDRFCAHDFGAQPDGGLVVRLGAGFTLNTVDFHLYDFDPRRYCVAVALSLDGLRWNEVYSTTATNPIRGRKTVRFEPQRARFVRLAGSCRNPGNGPSVMPVIQLRAYYAKK